MAKKKSSGPNKSEAIREVLRKDPDATAKVIIPELAKQGVDVSQDLVNNVRSIFLRSGGGKSPRKMGAKKRGSKANASVKKGFSYDDLMEVKRVAETLGGIDEAKKALDALADLR